MVLEDGDLCPKCENGQIHFTGEREVRGDIEFNEEEQVDIKVFECGNCGQESRSFSARVQSGLEFEENIDVEEV